LLDQDEVWVDAKGVAHQITEMEPGYCRNVIRFLEQRAEAIAHQIAAYTASVPLPPIDTVAYDDVSTSIAADTAAAMRNPLAWLAQAPLLVALRQRADEQPPAQR
jgi:hypothetical protein